MCCVKITGSWLDNILVEKCRNQELGFIKGWICILSLLQAITCVLYVLVCWVL